MYFLLIASFLTFSIVFFFRLKHVSSIESKTYDEFWARENKANFTRKKPLDNLNYITIPGELLNMKPENSNEELDACIRDLNDLSAYTIVNLTGYTNTDLKLEYGTANITILSEYDFHYTNLAALLQKLAEKLHESGNDALAVMTLEFAVSTNTDVSKSYYLLAQLYIDAHTPEKIFDLMESAQNIKSIQRDIILKHLGELLPI